jgi:hypothetical protein
VAARERQFAKGDWALIDNTGFRRYFTTISDQSFAIDPDKIEEEKRFGGIFVPEIIAALDSLTETEIQYDGKRFILRSAPRPAASLALRTASRCRRPSATLRPS